MKKPYLLILLSIFCLHPAPVMAAQMQSASYTMKTSVFSGGGGPGTSASYQLNASIGQVTAIVNSQSASYKIQAGFWYQLLKLIAGGDVNSDGVIDLKDAVLVLQILSQFLPAGIDKDADVNGDGVIGAQEAIYILQKLALLR